MDIIRFQGRVLPETVKVSVQHQPRLKSDAPELGVSMEFAVKIIDSNIDVECKVSEYRPELLSQLRLRAFDLCRASINLVAFNAGLGLTTILDRFVDPTGVVSIIHVHNPKLAAGCTAFSLTGSSFDAVHNLVLEDFHLSVVLNDLIAALSTTHATQTNCARVLDALKHRMAPPGSSDNAAWQQMRDNLNLSKPYLTFITGLSKDTRHGKLPIISEADAEEILLRSWCVMNRYFEFRKRGNKSLPLIDFPLL